MNNFIDKLKKTCKSSSLDEIAEYQNLTIMHNEFAPCLYGLFSGSDGNRFIFVNKNMDSCLQQLTIAYGIVRCVLKLSAISITEDTFLNPTLEDQSVIEFALQIHRLIGSDLSPILKKIGA